MEVADKQANSFRNSPADSGIHYVRSSHPLKAREPKRPCFRCGEDHIPQICWFKEKLSQNCKSKEHIAKVCKKKAQASSGGYAHGSRPNQGGRRQPVRYVEDDTPKKEPSDDFKLFHIRQEKLELSTLVPVKVNGENFSIELDTGASVSIMTEEAWRRRFPKVPLEESQIKFKTYTGEALEIIGQALVEETYQDKTTKLPLQILKGNGPSLFGRNWLKNIKLNWWYIKKISCDLQFT